MKIISGHRNPYFIYFPKTDDAGRTSLSSDRIRGQFEDHWEAGLMDYSGTLDTAKQRVTFFLYGLETRFRTVDGALVWPLLKNEKAHWQSRQEQVNYVISSRNSSFLFWRPFLRLPAIEQEVNLWLTPSPWQRVAQPGTQAE